MENVYMVQHLKIRKGGENKELPNRP